MNLWECQEPECGKLNMVIGLPRCGACGSMKVVSMANPFVTTEEEEDNQAFENGSQVEEVG